MAKPNLNVVLGNMGVQGIDRLRGGGAQLNLQGANVGLDPEYAQKAQEIGNFSNSLQTLGSAFGSWMQKRDVEVKKTGEDRANYLMQHFTPEQLQKARQDGALQFQDDPYAMKALNIKIGQSISMDVDSDISKRIQNGEFADRASLDKARATAMNQQAKGLAEAYGANFDDTDLQAGMNSQVVERNITLYGQHDSWLDTSLKNKAQVQQKTEQTSLFRDENFLKDPNSVSVVFGKQSQDRKLAGWSDDVMQANTKSAIADIANSPGGLSWINNAEKTTVDYNGQKISPKALFSEEQWQSLKLKATSVQFDRDAAVKEKFNVDLASIQYNPDIDEAERQLAILKESYNKQVPTDISTPERDQMIALEKTMIAKRAEQNLATQKQLVKRNQDENKFMVFDQQFNKRLSGQFVPTDYANMPSNEATGEFTRSDAVNYANRKLAQIDASSLTQEQKDDRKMALLRADSEKGPFREMYGVAVSDAQREWSGAVISGKKPESTPAMDNLRRVRARDPALFNSLYPEQGAFFNTMDQMDQLGVDAQVFIDADRQVKSQSIDQRRAADENWKSLKNDSTSPELSRLPTQLDSTARQIYDATVFRTGNNDLARDQVNRFLKENTVTFTGDDVEGDTIGVVPRNLLTVTDDPASYTQGKAILERAKQGITQANPWVTSKNLDITTSGNNIYITDTTGQIRVRYDRDTLARVYREEQTREMTKVEAEALAKATERAPISQIPKARKQAAERVQQKRKQVPNNIYGGQSEGAKAISDDFGTFINKIKGN